METLRHRGQLSTLRTKHCDAHNSESGCTAVIHRGELAPTERVAVSVLGVRGDAPQWRASPLEVTVHGVPQDGPTDSVDGPTHRKGRPHEPATGRPVKSVTPNRVSLRCV